FGAALFWARPNQFAKWKTIWHSSPYGKPTTIARFGFSRARRSDAARRVQPASGRRGARQTPVRTVSNGFACLSETSFGAGGIGVDPHRKARPCPQLPCQCGAARGGRGL